MAIREGVFWGARGYPPYGDGTVLVKQTVRHDSEFVIDSDDASRHRERHVNYQDDGELARAIRDALRDQLGNDG